MLRMFVWTAYSELSIEQQTKYTSKAIAMHSVNDQSAEYLRPTIGVNE